jgi:hypothetical protein
MMKNRSGQAINEEGSSLESFIPEFEWHGRMGKKSKANFNNVAMLTLCGTVLLMCVKTRYKVCSANMIKEGT